MDTSLFLEVMIGLRPSRKCMVDSLYIHTLCGEDLEPGVERMFIFEVMQTKIRKGSDICKVLVLGLGM